MAILTLSSHWPQYSLSYMLHIQFSVGFEPFNYHQFPHAAHWWLRVHRLKPMQTGWSTCLEMFGSFWNCRYPTENGWNVSPTTICMYCMSTDIYVHMHSDPAQYKLITLQHPATLTLSGKFLQTLVAFSHALHSGRSQDSSWLVVQIFFKWSHVMSITVVCPCLKETRQRTTVANEIEN